MIKDELEKDREPRDSREFFLRGVAVWIPAALFVLLVLFQMIPLPAVVLKVVSPATYELYEEMLPEVGKRQRSEVRSPVRRTTGRQKSEGQEQGTEVGDQKLEVGREWRSISINRHGTLRILLKFLSYIGIFFIVLYFNPSGQKGNRQEKSSVSVRSRKGAVPDFIFKLIWLIFFLGIFNALFSFLQEVSRGQIQWLRPLAPPGSYLGTFKSPNNFSEFLEMVVPLAMGLLIVQNYAEVKRFSQRLGVKTARMVALFSKTGLLSFGIIILIPALFFSLCRGGFVTFPVTMVVTLIFMVLSYRLHDRYSFVLFGFVVAGGFAYLIWMGAGPIIKEAMTIFSPGSRLFTYSDAIDIIKDFPIFGVGLGAWHDIIMKYHTMVGRETWMPAIAYNDTLQITAETGFAGLACVAAFLFMIYRKAIKALRKGVDVVSQALILGGITAMTAALIHCQFDYLFVLPSNAVVFMAIAGMTYRLSITN
ncbi:MAG: hypothetical protein SRB1_02114 [Desulfobacteraceae bacterium Eth-SRB1]|nr:MAG: hypothetical protein SRB1_02114 [Desulfobacteraceae bacterium Eth-SRB1]